MEDITAWMAEDYFDEPSDERSTICPLCGETVGAWLYDVDGDWGCEECFLTWVFDLEPGELADMMDVDRVRAD